MVIPCVPQAVIVKIVTGTGYISVFKTFWINIPPPQKRGVNEVIKKPYQVAKSPGFECPLPSFFCGPQNSRKSAV